MWPRILATVASALVPVSFFHSIWELTFIEPADAVFRFILELVRPVLCAPMIMCAYSYFKKPGRLWALSLLLLGVFTALTPWAFSMGIFFFNRLNVEFDFGHQAFAAYALTIAGIIYIAVGYLALKQTPGTAQMKETTNQQDSNAFVRFFQRPDRNWPRILTTIGVVLLLSTIVIPIQEWSGTIKTDPVTLLHIPPLWVIVSATFLMCLYSYFKPLGNRWSAWIIVFGFTAILTAWSWPTATLLWDGIDEQGRITGGAEETYRSWGTYLITLAGLATIIAGNLILTHTPKESHQPALDSPNPEPKTTNS